MSDRISLWMFAEDNGEVEPWLWENEWVFEGFLILQSWMIGIEYYDRCLSLHVGPLKINWWRK